MHQQAMDRWSVNGEAATVTLNPTSLEDYRLFLSLKRLPSYGVEGNQVHTTAHYLQRLSEDRIVIPAATVQGMAPHLWDYQRWIVNAALRKRKFAVFADAGLGKTSIFLEWVRHVLASIPGKVLIVSPLMIIGQLIEECRRWYGDALPIVNVHDTGPDAWLESDARVGIVNNEKFYGPVSLPGVNAIVIDESSSLKAEEGRFRTNIIAACKGMTYKLCCTATPAPNDRTEYANHALLLDQVRRADEFYARWFVNRDGEWQFKAHAAEAFYRYLAGWSVFVRSPAAYGFADNLAGLQPPLVEEVPIDLTAEQHRAMAAMMPAGHQLSLIPEPQGMTARQKFSQIAKGFLLNGGKVAEHIPTLKPAVIAGLLDRHPGEQSLVWTVFDEEGEILAEALRRPGRTVAHLTGKTPQAERQRLIEAFRHGEIDVMISKPKLLGFGLNFQFCSVMVFSGLQDSFEQYYQSIKRAHRYGATRQLTVYLPYTPLEEPMLRNVLSKQATYLADAEYQEKLYIVNLAQDLRDYVEGVKIMGETQVQRRAPVVTSDYHLINGDCVEELAGLPEASVDLSVFSPPFAELYTYSSDIADMGNSEDSGGEFSLHFKFFLNQLFRVMKPGRNVCLHLSQLVAFKAVHGYLGLRDFRGKVIDLCQEAGFIYYGEATIPKNPQAQALRTNALALLFKTLETNSAKSRPALNDYLLLFQRPGETEVPVKPECNRVEWVEWASGVWTSIRESHVLSPRGTKGDEAEKHICPLQLDLIERCIRLYSNRGELVLSPFMGIGSEGHVAGQWGRRFLGTELKPEYFATAAANIAEAYRVADAQLRLEV